MSIWRNHILTVAVLYTFINQLILTKSPSTNEIKFLFVYPSRWVLVPLPANWIELVWMCAPSQKSFYFTAEQVEAYCHPLWGGTFARRT